ncbi:MAG: hypothetical protein RJB66_35 [Pseudomonadota bacterium]|jgi:hypothetical protein
MKQMIEINKESSFVPCDHCKKEFFALQHEKLILEWHLRLMEAASFELATKNESLKKEKIL